MKRRNIPVLFSVTAVALAVSGLALAQPSTPPDVLPPPAEIPPPFPFPSPDPIAVPGAGARPAWACPASGYAEPRYGYVGRNADGPAAAEAASPCSPMEVAMAADAAGMARDGRAPYGFKYIIGLQFRARGTFAVDGARPEKVDSIEFQGDYTKPAVRLIIKRGERTDIRVSSEKLAWNEATEGGDASPIRNGAAAAREMEILLKLTPFGGLWSAIEAEGHAKVSKTANGMIVLNGVSPYDGLDATTTLNNQGLPATITVKDGRNTYAATFANYRGTANPQKIEWEPFYHTWFPTKITWTKNGRPFADLEVYGFFSNPYVVFPVPANLRTASR